MFNNLLLYIVAINVFSFLAFYIDKQKAVSGGFRISEFLLIFLSAIGGYAGSIIAIYTVRHKNKKLSFLFKFYLVFVMEILAAIYKFDLIKL